MFLFRSEFFSHNSDSAELSRFICAIFSVNARQVERITKLTISDLSNQLPDLAHGRLTPFVGQAVSELIAQLDASEFQPENIVHLSQAIPEIDILAWLAANSDDNDEVHYWNSRYGVLASGGLHRTLEISSHNQSDWPDLICQIKKYCEDCSVRFYGGFSFAGDSGADEWQDFPSALFWLPAVEVEKLGNRYRLSVNLVAGTYSEWLSKKSQLIVRLQQLKFAGLAALDAIRRPSDMRLVGHSLNDFAWHQKVNEALHKILQNDFSKVVLARSTRFEMAQELNLPATLNYLRKQNPDNYHFLFQQSRSAFIGSSPERLFCRRGKDLYTEAVAGTVQRGESIEQDFQLAELLMKDAKLVREHRWVVRFLNESLKPFAVDIRSDVPGLLKQKNVQHRFQSIQAHLKAETSTSDLLAALHPSPAVCGYPKGIAMSWLVQTENFQRGWYSGAVGTWSKDEVDLSVALRSALVTGNQVLCFAGAGIVAGSLPDQEWCELDNKIQTICSALVCR